MMRCSTSPLGIILLGTLIAVGCHATAQDNYPNKPIRFIVPYSPGSSTGTLARIIGQKLSERWGQPIIVDDRGGANTIIGSEALVKSNPDGYTILAMASTHVIVPLLQPTPFDAIKDFAPVATVATNEQILVLNPSVPANNLREFIAMAKSKPGQLNYASGGSGTVTHLTAELFSITADIKMQHIPYKGSAPALTDLMAGRVQMFFSPPIITIPLVKSGRIKAIAVSGDARLSALPQVPTFAEAGLPGLDVKVWFGVLAPARTPKTIIDKLSTEIARILAIPDTKANLSSQGMEPFVSTPSQFAALMKADTAKYAKVIKAANIKIE